jgi:hypothetical protein
VGVVELCLKGGDGGGQGRHLVEHLLVLLGGVRHVVDVLLHLLFRKRFGGDGSGGAAIRFREAFDDLINEAGSGVGLAVEAEGVGGDNRLAFSNGFLGGFEVVFEIRPSLVEAWFIVPFADVAGENGRTGDDDQADVDGLRR